MTTSGTNNFTFSVEELIEKAFQWVGGELTSGEDLRQAKKSLDLLFIDLQNRGTPLAKLKKQTFTTTSAVATYTLDATVVDVLDVVLTRNGVDTPLDRLDLFEYHRLPKKTIEGRPVQFATDRQEGQINLYLYLTPENSTDVIDYWCIKRIEDTGAYTNTVDFSYRYLPALTFGLAYFLSLERNGFPADKRAELRQNYIDTLAAAMSEDRSRASYRFLPPRYFRR